MSQEYKESDLERWLRARNLTTNDLVGVIGCSRTTIWKVKRGIAISSKFATRIQDLTQGAVNPFISNAGG